MKNVSAGLLLYRSTDDITEYFLVHPGGPYFSKKDKGWWTIPKGLPNEGETLEQAAVREFQEETGLKVTSKLLPIGNIKQKGGKTVHSWAAEGELPEDWVLKCNSFPMEWPPRSGKWIDCPEVDQGGFFKEEEALANINEAQRAFIYRLKELLAKKSS